MTPRTPAELDPAAVLAAGAMAPSSHNAQPWRLRWHDGAVEIHGEPGRGLPATDPEHRELRMACGAALANVRLAVRAQGRRAHVRLLPDPDDPWFLGVVTVGSPWPATELENRLAQAVPRRRTDRSALSGRGATARVREELVRAGQQEHCWIVFLDAGDERRRLHDLTARAHAAQTADPGFRSEWARWIGGDDSDDGSGMPTSRARHEPRSDGRWRVRDFGDAADPGDDRPAVRADDDPALLVVATSHDQPVAHLHAGQAMEHVLLLATVRGLAASFVASPVEVAATRVELRTLLGGAVWPQMVLRVGTSSHPIRPTPRRPVAQDG